MGIGCGDYHDLDTNSEILEIEVDGLKEWFAIYDSQTPIKDFDEYWKAGWKLALQVRKLIPAHIDLYYMCYNPSSPEEYIDYDSRLPKLIVPHTREIYDKFPTTEAKSLKEWEDKSFSAASDYVFSRTSQLLSIEGGIACAKDSFLEGAKKAIEAQLSVASQKEGYHTVNVKNLEVHSDLQKISDDAFQAGYQWQIEYGQHLFMDSRATLMLEFQDNIMIKNAQPENQWSNRPGNAPTSGFNGKYKFYFKENLTTIKNGDKVALHPHGNKGGEKSSLFRVIEITDCYIVVDSEWAILNKCDLWDIELVEVSK